MSFKIVIEGGGDGKALKAQLASGFSSFFEAVSPDGKKARIIRGGGRTDAIDKFVIEWKSRKEDDILLLLIDSEEPVKYGDSRLNHLKKFDGWTQRPNDVEESNVFFMVCVMETWICSDIDTLHQYFGGGFKADKIPKINNLESTPRDRIFDALKKATSDCKSKIPYSKSKHSFELIGLISPEKVAQLPHGKEFIDAYKKHAQPR